MKLIREYKQWLQQVEEPEARKVMAGIIDALEQQM
jgi:hypothetical protein